MKASPTTPHQNIAVSLGDLTSLEASFSHKRQREIGNRLRGGVRYLRNVLMLGINKPHYVKLCAKRMRDATGDSDVETNAMADEIVALLTDDKLDTNGVKKRSKSTKHY